MPLKNKIDREGINLLGKERPDILIKICQENFLPPTQLIYALQALEWYPDKQLLQEKLLDLVGHWSNAISDQAIITLGYESLDEPA